MERVNRKFETASAPLAVERGIGIALQLAGFICVCLALRVPSPLAVPVAGAGCSAILTLALLGTDRRRRLLQIFAASIALLVAIVLLVEGPDSLAKVPAEPTQSHREQLTPPSASAIVAQKAPARLRCKTRPKEAVLPTRRGGSRDRMASLVVRYAAVAIATKLFEMPAQNVVRAVPSLPL